MSFYAASESEEKTYVDFHPLGSEAFEVYFSEITNKFATVSWKKIMGGDNSESYLIEYGVKGFERGKGQQRTIRYRSFDRLFELESNTEYSFFIRSEKTSPTDPVWFVEHTFKTLPCNTEISGIKSRVLWTDCICHNGAVGMEIMWDDMADSYELEYGLKGFQKGTGEIIKIEKRDYMYTTGVAIFYEYLTSYTDYDFYIRAECNTEFGEWTSVNSFSTPKLHTSIENVRNSNFKIFPNPVEDVLHINLGENKTANLKIYNLQGSLLLNKNITSEKGIDVSFLSSGLYFVVIDKQYISSIIKK